MMAPCSVSAAMVVIAETVPDHFGLFIVSLVSFFPVSLVSFFSVSPVSFCFLRNNNLEGKPFLPAVHGGGPRNPKRSKR